MTMITKNKSRIQARSPGMKPGLRPKFRRPGCRARYQVSRIIWLLSLLVLLGIASVQADSRVNMRHTFNYKPYNE